MRGKLRDKPATARRDRLKRELMERRRPPRRENRNAVLFNQQLEEDYVPFDEAEELTAVEQRQQ
ncbi:MAG TPA: hypothetical protein VF043_08405 [Ktedonobacteraceae bacterium]